MYNPNEEILETNQNTNQNFVNKSEFFKSLGLDELKIKKNTVLIK